MKAGDRVELRLYLVSDYEGRATPVWIPVQLITSSPGVGYQVLLESGEKVMLDSMKDLRKEGNNGEETSDSKAGDRQLLLPGVEWSSSLRWHNREACSVQFE